MIKTLKEIDDFRKKGLRPQVAGCFLNNRKVLLCYKKEHDLWQLPQGGIRNLELIEDAFLREMTEELGQSFVRQFGADLKPVTEAKVEFPLKKHAARNLETDAGEPITMRGKKYFFLAVLSSSVETRPEKTEFDDCKWSSYEEAMKSAEKIYQKGKKRITTKALKELKSLGLIT
ncbi:MAG: NUDIX domain-containing protein [bacterium]|nr:NUDIX domain-containing protein [bacterium]